MGSPQGGATAPPPPRRTKLKRRTLSVLPVIVTCLILVNLSLTERWSNEYAPSSPVLSLRGPSVTEAKGEAKDSPRQIPQSNAKKPGGNVKEDIKAAPRRYGGRSLGLLRESDYPPRPESPYEKRRPGHSLPPWAGKAFYLRQTNYPQRVCFVHVGKTAGSTVGCALGFQLHCKGVMHHPPGLLPSYATNMIHSHVNDCTLKEDFFLVTLRDPLERIKSWYSYEQSSLEKLKKDCRFITLNVLAERGLTRDHQATSDKCRGRALRTLQGTEMIGFHAYQNYGFYLKQLPHNASIAVIRSEHLVDDWNSMEALLGSSAKARKFPSKNTVSLQKDLNKELTPRAQQLLCAALCQEVQVYKHLLHVALNLTPKQVRESLRELRHSCPLEADAHECPPTKETTKHGR